MFEVGKRYHRLKEIHEPYGGSRQSGISPSSTHPYIFLFFGKSGEAFGYEDGWQPDEQIFLYTGQGQIGDMEFIRGNKAIRDHVENQQRLFLFRAEGKGQPVTFIGEFECVSFDHAIGFDVNGNTRRTIRFNLMPMEASSADENDDARINDTSLLNLRKLAFEASKAKMTPDWRLAKQIRRQRSLQIKQYVLLRAGGCCELTGKKAPFEKPNGEPFLEVHHIKKLSDGGIDHPVNCAAISPNVHREIHFGANGRTIDDKLEKIINEKEELLNDGTQ